ncbi:hypothetical protein JOQ06_028859 [Pogonophryne albipinna]|uniref:Uncharacterized protein n=1 Tax=Pogonophryne albipinna TaxID=1090488 RepID=A0AAD6B7B0_9TELE|nr:hypothetical protein JOQ06_028859 [Pogonophryne albipinna]
MWTVDGKMNFTHSLDDERRWETGAVLMLTAAVDDAATPCSLVLQGGLEVRRHEEQHLNLINPPISSYSLGQCQHLEEASRQSILMFATVHSLPNSLTGRRVALLLVRALWG